MSRARGLEIGFRTCVVVFLGLRTEIVVRFSVVVREKESFGKMTCGVTN